MKLFYLAVGSLELHLNEEALGYYLRLAESGFHHSTYLSGQLALAYYNLKGTFLYMVLQKGCRERHSTRASTRNFEPTFSYPYCAYSSRTTILQNPVEPIMQDSRSLC